MSGMNSGLDTESIINALTANSKLKITKQERNVMKYEETQKAYQDITSKMQALKDKYFNLLNSQNNLSGSSMWNKYASKTYLDGTETTMAGFSAQTTVNSQPGEYTMKVKTNAKQATMKGGSLSSNASISDSELSKFEENKEYGFTIDVGGVSKNITFKGGANANATLENINQALEDAYGESNDSAGDKGVIGMVYVDPATHQFMTKDGKGITVSGIGSMSNSNEIDLSSAVTGTNTLTLQVGGQTVTTSFQSIKSDYFDNAIGAGLIKSDGTVDWDVTTGDNRAAFDEFVKNVAKQQLTEELGGEEPTGRAIELRSYQVEAEINDAAIMYEQVVNDYKESVRYDAFKAWKASATDSQIDNLYNKALIEHKDNQISKWVVADDDMKAAYTDYQNTFASNALSSEALNAYNEYKNGLSAEEQENAKGLYEWAQDNDEYKKAIEDAEPAMKSAYTFATENGSFTEKLTKLEHKYAGIGNGESDYDDAYYNDGYTNYLNKYAENNLSTEAKSAYDAYVSSTVDAGNEPKGIYEWATDTTSGFDNETAQKDLEDARISYNLSTEAKLAYATYKINLASTDTPLRVSEWVADTTSGFDNAKAREDIQEMEEPIKDFATWKNDKIESDSWKLDKSTFTSTESSMFTQYKKSEYDEEHAVYNTTKENVIDHFNRSALKNSIGSIELSDGTKFEVNYDNDTNKAVISAYKETTDSEGNTTRTDVGFSVTAAKDSANNFGVNTAKTNISQISNTTKLSDLNIAADENGNYNFKINGHSFSFDGNTTVNDMMKKINASSAGVKMSYSSLDNAFTITASKYGVDSEVNITDDSQGLMSALGLSGKVNNGSNLVVNINGTDYESAGNSIEADGTTFTFTDKSKIDTEFTVNIEKDTSAIANVIKDFIKDYNQLIEDVYKYLDEKPEKDYYFLTDADKEDLDLTDKQEEKWEEKAKKGLLYHDSTVTAAMTQLRTALMGSIEGLDGNAFSLSLLGLKTQSDYNKHGMFSAINDDTLNAAIEGHSDDIMKLFTDDENGIMKKFQSALDAAVGTTGTTKGTLIRKAGLSTGTSSTDNELFRNIKRTKQRIASLTTRYENEQNRLWKRYSSMESMMGTLNSQQASFASYFAQ